MSFGQYEIVRLAGEGGERSGKRAREAGPLRKKAGSPRGEEGWASEEGGRLCPQGGKKASVRALLVHAPIRVRVRARPLVASPPWPTRGRWPPYGKVRGEAYVHRCRGGLCHVSHVRRTCTGAGTGTGTEMRVQTRRGRVQAGMMESQTAGVRRKVGVRGQGQRPW